MNQLRACQKKAHEWGRHNRVEFDGDKEAFVILHPSLGEGDVFRLLGLMVDNQLRMQAAVDALLKKARPKLQALMRTRAFYDLDNMVLQYKTHVLGIVESVTAGIYHAGSSILAPLDRVQTTFVHNFNLDVIDAFMNHNLAPLSLRRDIAMLGFLHKCILPGAHPEMEKLFPRQGNGNDGAPRRLWNILTFSRRTFHPDLARRSLFGLTYVYNALPEHIVSLNTVQEFQHELTDLARRKIRHGHGDWETFLSPRSFNGVRGLHLP